MSDLPATREYPKTQRLLRFIGLYPVGNRDDYVTASVQELLDALAERNRMLHNAWWEKSRNLQNEDEWMEDMRAGAKADLRACAEEGSSDA